MFPTLALAFASALCLAPRADQFSVQSGAGDNVDVNGVGWEVPLSDACNGSRRVRGGWLFRLDNWHGNKPGGLQVLGASVTPFVRYEVARLYGTPLYIEGGGGANLLSRTRIDEQRRFSTAFQFGEFVGFSTRYGKQGQFGARLQHVSNASIKQPNNGLTYGMVFFNYNF